MNITHLHATIDAINPINTQVFSVSLDDEGKPYILPYFPLKIRAVGEDKTEYDCRFYFTPDETKAIPQGPLGHRSLPRILQMKDSTLIRL